MANPQAVMRAAQGAPMGDKMGGPPESMEGPEAAHGAPPNAPGEGGGMDSMMQALQGVGEFLKSQGPAGQQAMSHFQALLQSMAKIGQEAPEMGGEDQAPRRIHESQNPGVQVL